MNVRVKFEKITACAMTVANAVRRARLGLGRTQTPVDEVVLTLSPGRTRNGVPRVHCVAEVVLRNGETSVRTTGEASFKRGAVGMAIRKAQQRLSCAPA